MRAWMLILVVVWTFAMPSVSEAAPLRVGVVTDGAWEGVDAEVDRIRTEVERVFQSSRGAVVEADAVRQGAFSRETVEAALDELLAAPNVDVVVALGTLASGVAAGREGGFSKPVVAPWAVPGLPSALPGGPAGSGVENLNYLAVPITVAESVEMLRGLRPFTQVAVVTNAALVEGVDAAAIPGLPEGVTVSLVPWSADLDLSTAFDGVEAVVVGPLEQHREGLPELAAVLREAKLPSFSMVGRPHVEAGILSGTGTAGMIQTIARRAALNIEKSVRGRLPMARLPTEVQQRAQLVLNESTMRVVGLAPSWRDLAEADMVGGEDDASDELGMGKAANRAMVANLDLLTETSLVEADAQAIADARSGLFPQIGIGVDGTIVDADRAATSFGSLPQYAANFTARITQVIYDEDLYAAPRVQTLLQEAREQGLNGLKLDVGAQAAFSYLDVVGAFALEAVRRNDLDRNREYLDIARTRVRTGAGGQEEVERWTVLVADARRQLALVWSQRRASEQRLAQLLDIDQAEPPSLAAEDLSEVNVGEDKRVTERVFSDPSVYGALGAFLVAQGHTYSPELKQITASIEAEERALAQRKRAYFAPKIGLGFDIQQRIAGAGAGTPESVQGQVPGFEPPDGTMWSAVAGASLPLFEGGRRSAAVKESKKRVSAFEIRLQNARDLVERDVRSSLHELLGSRLGYEAALDAKTAATRNFELVGIGYIAGTRRLVDLVDARSAAIDAELAEVQAQIKYLRDFVRIQRATGRLLFVESAEDVDAFFSDLAFAIGDGEAANPEGGADGADATVP